MGVLVELAQWVDAGGVMILLVCVCARMVIVCLGIAWFVTLMKWVYREVDCQVCVLRVLSLECRAAGCVAKCVDYSQQLPFPLYEFESAG